MFITPNIRVLAWVGKFAEFMYPDPYVADENGKIPPVDDNTFTMARELIGQSDNPSRKLNREGLVLEGSYAATPWLIYKNNYIPWASQEKMNTFAVKYLHYGTGEDREFVVRAKIGILSLLRYLLIKK